jgi:hypothetical protein
MFLLQRKYLLHYYWLLLITSRSARGCPGSNVSLCKANSFWKGFLLNQPTLTPYSAAAVPGIDTIFTFFTIYFEIQTGVTWLCPGHHIEVIKCIMRERWQGRWALKYVRLVWDICHFYLLTCELRFARSQLCGWFEATKLPWAHFGPPTPGKDKLIGVWVKTWPALLLGRCIITFVL